MKKQSKTNKPATTQQMPKMKFERVDFDLESIPINDGVAEKSSN